MIDLPAIYTASKQQILKLNPGLAPVYVLGWEGWKCFYRYNEDEQVVKAAL